ncbi:folate-binding protein [Phycicoccus sp. MAQZ13P-2]|uniref:CAF17-like 4Fe-4S cluster assembly/insertion protein YgfZ n=1 Tax=Phycicoccus mangrovi TaxID=2840470 RepID=UPI001BFFDD80|nr:folate-binding protein [Phycicoccus mangrovi]MBT9256116.1 folate-binding protein [Phycicoccus mangrovi]MBT9273869.1 folate-binding protein [Phycicoccus mangrovi]
MTASVQTTRSPLLDRHGAVEGEGPDAGVAAHYGDPMREQRLLTEGLAVVDLSHRGVVTVTGPDRLTWLHSMTTQQLAGLAPRSSAESLVLSPKGHVEHALHVVDDGTSTWLTLEPGTAPALVAWLESMRFMLRVEVADVTDAWAVLGEPVGAESADGEPLAWVDPWPRLVGDTAAYGPVEGHAGAGRAWRELLVPRDGLEAAVGDRPLAGTWAAEALRVAAWRPRLGHETDHRTIPHEVDWLRTAVHLHKGCYRGQETIARVHNLGRPPRRLVFLHLDGSGHVLPAVGSPLTLEGREVGRLTSVARHHEDGPVALGVVKRSVAEDVDLLVDGVSAAQTVVVRG